MQRQDRQGVRTPAGLERKYAIGQSFKKAQGGIQKATEDAGAAKKQAQSANVGLEKVEKTAQEAKITAREAKQVAAETKSAVDGISLTVENGQTTAKIILKVGDTQIPVTIDMQGLVSILALQTAGGIDINGKNITGTVELTGERDEEGGYQEVKMSPEGVKVKLLEQNEAAEEVERACVELRPEALMFPLGNGAVTGLAEPEEDTDAVNKGYLAQYVSRELDKLREELTNKETETGEQE